MILRSGRTRQILPPGKFLHGRNKPVQEFVYNNFGLDRKIKEACAGLKPSFQWALNELRRKEDKELIADFILNYSNERGSGMPMSTNTRKLCITALVYLARHNDDKKSFKEMTPDDFYSKEIIDEKTGKKRGYLENLKRSFDEDIQQKWVNTYNNRFTKYIVFTSG
jgi:transcriptional accessory protein Tex/SPT6